MEGIGFRRVVVPALALLLLLEAGNEARAEDGAAPFHRRPLEAASAVLERARDAAAEAIAATGAAARDPVLGPPLIATIALLAGFALGAGLARRRPRPAGPSALELLRSEPRLPEPAEAVEPSAQESAAAEAEPQREPEPLDAAATALATPAPLAHPFASWSPERVALVEAVVRVLEEEAAADAQGRDVEPAAADAKPAEAAAA